MHALGAYSPAALLAGCSSPHTRGVLRPPALRCTFAQGLHLSQTATSCSTLHPRVLHPAAGSSYL